MRGMELNREKTYEELKKENEELRELLTEVCNAYEILNKALDAHSDLLNNEKENATIENASDVKKLLNKYSRL